MKNDGNIPVLKVSGKTSPEVWEKSLLRTWKEGVSVKTEYDKKDDPPSRDCTMIMEIKEPLAEPRLHRAFPAGLEDLEIYRQEVLNGIHDHWIDLEDKNKWNYTYHERLFTYEAEKKIIDQINDFIIPKLAEVPYSRRAQAVTWKTWLDLKVDDPPCLQRIWVRCLKNNKGKLVLSMNTHWRSRDGFKAAFMNIFVFTGLQKIIADRISELIKKPVLVGRYVDISDSYHIYGSYFKDFRGFLKTVKKRTFEERTWTTSFAEPFFEEARRRVERENKGAG